MSASNGLSGYLVDWRNSFSLVRNNLQDCKAGTTFRGANSHVEMPLPLVATTCVTSARNSGGTAKPGPTTDTSSRIARIKKLQTRTRSTHVSAQSNGGTQRGAHATVQNGTWGVDVKSARAQLFGETGPIPGTINGRGGDSSDVIYFKKVFDRTTLQQPTLRTGNEVVDQN